MLTEAPTDPLWSIADGLGRDHAIHTHTRPFPMSVVNHILLYCWYV